MATYKGHNWVKRHGNTESKFSHLGTFKPQEFTMVFLKTVSSADKVLWKAWKAFQTTKGSVCFSQNWVNIQQQNIIQINLTVSHIVSWLIIK